MPFLAIPTNWCQARPPGADFGCDQPGDLGLSSFEGHLPRRPPGTRCPVWVFERRTPGTKRPPEDRPWLTYLKVQRVRRCIDPAKKNAFSILELLRNGANLEGPTDFKNLPTWSPTCKWTYVRDWEDIVIWIILPYNIIYWLFWYWRICLFQSHYVLACYRCYQISSVMLASTLHVFPLNSVLACILFPVLALQLSYLLMVWLGSSTKMSCPPHIPHWSRLGYVRYVPQSYSWQVAGDWLWYQTCHCVWGMFSHSFTLEGLREAST